MKTFSEYINEGMKKHPVRNGGRSGRSTIKMMSASDLTKVLADEKMWDEYKDAISKFFEDGSWSKGDYVSYDILDLFIPNHEFEEDSDFGYKKTTWVNADKRLRSALKKLKKEYVISTGECYKEMKDAMGPDGDITNEVIRNLLEGYKKGTVKVEYPELNYYTDAENWVKDFNFMKELFDAAPKDTLCLLMTEGIDHINVSESKGDENISVGGRTSALTISYEVEIIIYSTNKFINFTVSKTTVNRI